ncbi:hypothetical protein ID866_12063, partial [Astraeus odoratus]
MTSAAIHRASPFWHLKNCCPVCMYTLQGKPELKFSMLYAMDSNDSLKHAMHQQVDMDEVEDSPPPVVCEEILPGQELACDWYLMCEEVNLFAKDSSSIELHDEGVFHWWQAISNYFTYNDEFDIYANLSMFLYNNYKQALDIVQDACEQFPDLKQELNITNDSVFHAWLAEEWAYLLSHKKEPEEESMQM